MRCQEIELELPLYSDDILSAGSRLAIDAHLERCPLCRQRLSEYHEIRGSLRAMPRPEPSSFQINALRRTVSAKLRPAATFPYFALIETKRSFYHVWLMPYMVGSMASMIFATTLLWLLFLPTNRIDLAMGPDRLGSRNETAMFLANPGNYAPDLSPNDYAASRFSIAAQSPSVNPQGALIALTKSLVRGEMLDEEVVIVADVFGDGLAEIAEVVEYPRDRQKMVELRRALRSDPAFAPFVPANMDGRANSVRVVLKLQSVNVKADFDTPSN